MASGVVATATHLRPVGLRFKLKSPPVSNQVVVHRMMPDPDPRNLAILDVSQSSVTSADSNRPDSSADRLEVERRMTRVITPQSVVFARQFANSLRQLLVALPESRGAGRIHGKGRSVPDLRAARASSMRKSRRPLCASRAILSSQSRSRWSSNHLPSLKNSSAGRCSIAFSISCTVLTEAKLSPSRASRNPVFPPSPDLRLPACPSVIRSKNGLWNERIARFASHCRSEAFLRNTEN